MRLNVTVIGVLLALLSVGGALYFLPADPTIGLSRLTVAVGYALLILVFSYGFVILLKMATGEIDIRQLIGEVGGGASMSRFQLLVFTLVIAMSFFLIVAKNGSFPQISGEVLSLLGISATTYGVSKGIQASAAQEGKGKAPSPDGPKPPPPPGPPIAPPAPPEPESPARA